MILIPGKIALNRNELSGAFGDIGTDLPLIIGMLMATDLQATNVLIVFGILQILTAVVYGIPMPVQPLKAVAVITITQQISADVIYGGGLAIGVFMLLFTLTGLLAWLAKWIPKTVIRGIQLGLGIQLSLLALKDYIPSLGWVGYGVAGISALAGLIFLGNRRFPPALFILGIGVIFTLFNNPDIFSSVGLNLPHFSLPELNWQVIITGFIVLALPQIPLSLGNSIFATNQLANDYFPEKKVTIGKIGFTYSILNLTAPFLGGIPVCHGSGGIAGHYTFGGRTGGSTFIYGVFFLLLGLFLSGTTPEALLILPKPVLGVILVFEGIALIMLVKDIITDKSSLFIAAFVGVCAIGLPYGYLVGMVTGTIIFYFRGRFFLKHVGNLDR